MLSRRRRVDRIAFANDDEVITRRGRVDSETPKIFDNVILGWSLKVHIYLLFKKENLTCLCYSLIHPQNNKFIICYRGKPSEFDTKIPAHGPLRKEMETYDKRVIVV